MIIDSSYIGSKNMALIFFFLFLDKEDSELYNLENSPTYTFSRHVIRSTYMDKSIEAKKKVSSSSQLFIW